jgi:hypothetical protein
MLTKDKSLREIAARSAAVCAAAKTAVVCPDCLTALPPRASVTIVRRPIVSPNNQVDWGIKVPICLSCWLVELAAYYHRNFRGRRNDRPLDEASPFTDEWWNSKRLSRLRCEGCNRPMRVYDQRRYYLTLRERCCCGDCFHKATLRRANERRRVHHDKIKCVACRKLFVPTQSTAKTCSNTCRQRLHRRRLKQARKRGKR